MKPNHLLYCALALLISCGIWQACNKSDYQNAELGSHTADFAFPLFTTELKLKDLLFNVLNDTLSGDTIIVNPDNTMTLFYSGDVAKKYASDIFASSTLQIGVVQMNDSVTSTQIPGPLGVSVRVTDMKSGTLYFTFKNSTQDTLHGYYEIPYMTKNGDTLRTSMFLLAPGQSWNSGVIDITGYRLYSPQNEFIFKYFAYKNNGERVKLQNVLYDDAVFFANLQFSYLEGNWGNQNYKLTRDTIEIDINQTSLKGNVKVENPKVTMRIFNSWGFPTRGVIKYLSFIGQNGEEIPLVSNFFQHDNDGNAYVDFAYPAWPDEVGQTKFTDIYLDNTNSNIADIFNSQPTRLIYEVDAISNATSDPNLVGFITDQSVITFQVLVELLLEGSAKEFGAEQTLNMDFSNFNSLDSANIESVEFKLVAENKTPVDIHAQIYFRDEAGNNIDSLFQNGSTKIMESAPVTNGVAAGSTRTETFIPMTAERFDRIRTEVKTAYLKAYFTTAQGGEIPVKLLADNSTTLKMGIRVKKRIE